MCELLAVSSAHASRLSFSLSALAAHSAAPWNMRDGWGVAYCQGADVALFREPMAAADSALLRYLEQQGPATSLAISHIRHATQGAVALANTQPFVRELGGVSHCFAHNGNLSEIFSDPRFALDGRYQPVGQTDSEHAFCVLMSRLAALQDGRHRPSLARRRATVATFAADIASLGPANFLYSDAQVLFAHGHRRIQAASGRVCAPGLWTLQQHCTTPTQPNAAPAGLAVAQGDQSVVLLASVPLSAQAWQPLQEGQLLLVSQGRVLQQGDIDSCA
jgi:predicted glutamine amidotransferase